MRYRQDIPATAPQDVVDMTVEHIVAHLSAVTDEDDDPNINTARVNISIEQHEEHSDLISVIGEIDAEPQATYLREDFDPNTEYSDISFRRFEAEE
jgi:hypothetical protein